MRRNFTPVCVGDSNNKKQSILKRMKVLKFGGTSVGSVESILSLKNIVEHQTQPVIVVVSALGGITDKLIEIGRASCRERV